METIKAINEWTIQLMVLGVALAGMAWCGVGIVEAVKYAAKEWSKPAKRFCTKSGSEAAPGAQK